MKKLTTYTLAGLLCLSAMSGFAQTKQETAQDKILRLEVENQVLQRQNADLMQQVIELKAQQQAKIQPSTTTSWPASAQQSKPAPAKKSELKSYYPNATVQNLCENKFKKCQIWTTARFYSEKGNFKILNATYKEDFIKPSFFEPYGITAKYLYVKASLARGNIYYVRFAKYGYGENHDMIDEDQDGLSADEYNKAIKS